MNSFKRAIQNLIIDKSVTLSSLLVLVLTFFSIAIFAVFAFYSHFAIKYLEQSPQIFLYFTDEATEKYILEVKEIEIMKLVGATDWFVIKPYLLQGILYAIISSFIVGIMLFVSLPFILPQITAFFTGVPLPQITELLKSIGINLSQITPAIEQIVMLLILTFLIFLIGIIISVIGSLV